MTFSRVVFSRNSDEWETPQSVFDDLDKEFHFDLDPCATDENHKCSNYFTLADDGLQKSWGGYCVFCNPPYSKIRYWIKKAYEEAQKDDTTVVMLIPAKTDTRYFHEYIYHKAEIRFIKGRLKFGNSKNSAPFPSMIVVYRKTSE